MKDIRIQLCTIHDTDVLSRIFDKFVNKFNPEINVETTIVGNIESVTNEASIRWSADDKTILLSMDLSRYGSLLELRRRFCQEIINHFIANNQTDVLRELVKMCFESLFEIQEVSNGSIIPVELNPDVFVY